MHSNEMSDFVGGFLYKANELQVKKNADYHPDKVAFLEILRTCHECHLTVEQDLWGKIRKQYIAVHTYVIDGHVASEPLISRAMDVAVYMGMLVFWDQCKLQIVKDAMAFVGRQPCECTTTGSCDRCKFLGWLMMYRNELDRAARRA